MHGTYRPVATLASSCSQSRVRSVLLASAGHSVAEDLGEQRGRPGSRREGTPFPASTDSSFRSFGWRFSRPRRPSAPTNCSPGSIPRTELFARLGISSPRSRADLRAVVLIRQIAQELCVVAEVFPDRVSSGADRADGSLQCIAERNDGWFAAGSAAADGQDAAGGPFRGQIDKARCRLAPGPDEIGHKGDG